MLETYTQPAFPTQIEQERSELMAPLLLERAALSTKPTVSGRMSIVKQNEDISSQVAENNFGTLCSSQMLAF